MEEKNLDGYIVDSSDPHFSEYLPEQFKDRQWLTGFTGSNGIALVSKDAAYLWTDGRYFIQAENQLEGTGIELMKMATPGYPSLYEFVEKNFEKGSRLGVNPISTSVTSYKKLKEICERKEIILETEFDLLKDIWTDRPEAVNELAFVHGREYAGLSPEEKISIVRKRMKEDNIDVTIITALEDVAWLYNIRGFDIECNPYIISFALVDEENANIYVDFEKISIEMQEHFKSSDIETYKYEEISAAVNNLKNQNILINESKTSIALYNLIDSSNNIINSENIATIIKAEKNPVEIENQKWAYIKDGVALTKFIYWLKTQADIENETETTVAEKLESFRKEQDHYIMPSFGTISAYGSNAAMMHYSDNGNGVNLERKGLYLVDSGGQYLDGTTDITRTIALGDLTEEEKRDFTLVLMGHMKLVGTKFLEGATGHSLDAICRRPLWNNLIDYKCGTGHGVGYFLGVHEGPQRISTVSGDAALRPGMIVTIEPGVYRAGKHGIRTENVVLVKEAGESFDGTFYEFDMLSYAPIDRDAINPELLDAETIKLLNDYHKDVFYNISPYLEKDEKEWLKEVTKEI